ncbi:MAG: hypothetical protein H0V88_11635 [Pyrinomonadaceae bacterium]|nr:hypothetical protein [Pyrinomonadaceae bacterium]
MKKFRLIYALATFALTLAAASTGNVYGQSNPPAQASGNAPSQTRVLGEVASIDAAANRITVKTDAGATVTVILSEATKYMRIPAGETSVSKAVASSIAEIKVGDRVYVPGRISEDGQAIPARTVYVMARAEITQKNERERAEWRRRGIAGTVTALNPVTKEVTITARTREGMRPVVVAATNENIRFRRYAPDSVRFSDAKPSSFAELQVGDQLRALGERSTDGARFTPEEIVSGAFRTIGGRVTSVYASTNEIKLVDVQTQQPLTVAVNKDSTVRRLPAMMAQMLATRGQGGSGAPGAGAEGNGANRQGTPPEGAAQQQRPQRPGGAGGAAGTAGGEGGAPRMGGGGGQRDLGEMLENLPALNLTELKVGDMIIVSSTKSSDPSRVTAIAVLAGVEPLLTATTAAGGQGRPNGAPRSTNTNLGLPSDALGIGIGP